MLARRRQLKQIGIALVALWGLLFVIGRLDDSVTQVNFARLQVTPSEIVTSSITKPPKPPKPIHPFFQVLENQKKLYCNDSITVYQEAILVSKDAVIETRHAIGSPGGEDPAMVLNRNEQVEHYKLSPGFFKMSCTEFHVKNDWVSSVLPITPGLDKDNDVNFIGGHTVLVERNEYANVYWTLMDIYNVFVVLKFLNVDPRQATIILFDGHPRGPLDPLWTALFRSILRIKDLQPKTKFERLVWIFYRDISPLLSQSMQDVPVIGEFREYVLSTYGTENVKLEERGCNANRSMNLTFIWRRDYLSHPRNPNKIISRKISNEDELMSKAKSAFPKFLVRGFQLDALPIHQQISVIASTDVLIGMHGAGLAFTMLQPPGSGMIELYPQSYGRSKNWHMEYLAKWSGVLHESWQSNVISDENMLTRSSYIPPNTVMRIVSNMVDRICSNGRKIPLKM